jgi:hypothetical protein
MGKEKKKGGEGFRGKLKKVKVKTKSNQILVFQGGSI